VKHTEFTAPPSLRNPVLLIAFSGWVDGGQVATSAIRFLVDKWGATKFAEMDPEPFYNFARVRPEVHLNEDGSRYITWPETSFFYHADPELDRDYVLLLGIEPNFKWRTFSEDVLEVCQSIGITSALTIGGVIGDVPHTRPAPITVFTSDPDLHAKFPELTVRRGGYQGPTGILGVISASLEKVPMPIGNMRGLVPHYLSASRNPKVRHALLARLNELYGLSVDLSELETRSRRFERRVDRALTDRPELAEYVKGLEARIEGGEGSSESGRESTETEPRPTGGGELPSGQDIVRQLEDYFRERSLGQDDESSEPRPD